MTFSTHQLATLSRFLQTSCRRHDCGYRKLWETRRWRARRTADAAAKTVAIQTISLFWNLVEAAAEKQTTFNKLWQDSFRRSNSIDFRCFVVEKFPPCGTGFVHKILEQKRKKRSLGNFIYESLLTFGSDQKRRVVEKPETSQEIQINRCEIQNYQQISFKDSFKLGCEYFKI